MNQQIYDTLQFNGSKFKVHAAILWTSKLYRDEDFTHNVPYCYRGYIAEWKIVSNQLILVSISGDSPGVGKFLQECVGKVADWYSDQVFVELLTGDADLTCNSKMVFHFESGILKHALNAKISI